MEGWPRVASEEDWLRIIEERGEAYESGGFLLERLGAERYLDPKLMATILTLRQRLLDEWAITTAAETMLVDLALLSYYNALRVQGWTGDLAVRIEHEFFGDDAFTEMARKGHRRADRFAVEDRVRRLTEQLMPLLDRTNRMLIRNLKAIKELRQGQVPAVAIGRADHVTVTNRPNVRLRPVKTELPHAVSDPCSENLRGDLRYHRYHRGSARYLRRCTSLDARGGTPARTSRTRARTSTGTGPRGRPLRSDGPGERRSCADGLPAQAREPPWCLRHRA
jgi:hypothetical protein